VFGGGHIRASTSCFLSVSDTPSHRTGGASRRNLRSRDDDIVTKRWLSGPEKFCLVVCMSARAISTPAASKLSGYCLCCHPPVLGKHQQSSTNPQRNILAGDQAFLAQCVSSAQFKPAGVPQNFRLLSHSQPLPACPPLSPAYLALHMPPRAGRLLYLLRYTVHEFARCAQVHL